MHSVTQPRQILTRNSLTWSCSSCPRVALLMRSLLLAASLVGTAVAQETNGCVLVLGPPPVPRFAMLLLFMLFGAYCAAPCCQAGGFY